MPESIQLDQVKLQELIDLRREDENLDYKSYYDYSSKSKKDRVELAKDILAFANTPHGGYIVLGVSDDHFAPVGLPLDYQLDQATLQDKITPYAGREIKIYYAQHKIKIVCEEEMHAKTRLFGLIYIEQCDEPVVVAKEGHISLDNGDQESIFRCGDILIRKGSKSTKADNNDIHKMFTTMRAVDNQRNFETWRENLSALVSELINQNLITTGAQSDLERSSTEWQNLPRPDFGKFIGREDDVSEVKKGLLNSRAWIISIDGVGGVGKTALALKCAYDCWESRDFDLIVWTSAKSTRLTLTGIDKIVPSLTSLENLIDKIVRITFPEQIEDSYEKKIELVKWILSNSKTLLIVDNLETITDPGVFTFLRDLPEPSKALVTSRQRLGQGEKVIRLEGFSNDDAKEFLRAEAEKVGISKLTNHDPKLEEKIINYTGGIPLAIKWLIGQIGIGKSVHSAISDLASIKSDPLEFCFGQTYQMLDANAKLILKSVPLFDGEFSIQEIQCVTDLSPDNAQEGISELIKVSMLNESSLSTENPKYWALPMTRYFAQNLLDQETQSIMQKRLSSFYQKIGELSKLKQQATQLFENIGSSSEKGQTAAIMSQVAFGNYQRGKYEEAKRIFEQSVKLCPTLSFTYQTWASVEWQEGNYARARELWMEAARLDSKNSLIWRSWGLMEKELHNFPKSKECLLKSTELNEYDNVSWHALGFAYFKEREYQQAERCLLKALYFEPNNVNECHHNVVTFHTLAVVLAKQSRYSDANSYIQKGLALDRENTRLLSLEKQINEKSISLQAKKPKESRRYY